MIKSFFILLFLFQLKLRVIKRRKITHYLFIHYEIVPLETEDYRKSIKLKITNLFTDITMY